MKQNILLSAMLAAMLVIAGCGGGADGYTQAELDQAVEDGKKGLVSEADAKAREDNAREEGKMDAEQTQQKAADNRMALALYNAIDKAKLDPTGTQAAFKAVKDANKDSRKDATEGKAFNAEYPKDEDTTSDPNSYQVDNQGYYSLANTGDGVLYFVSAESDDFSTS